MKVFIGGVMQASRLDDRIVSQDYRAAIRRAIAARWPDVEVVDPLVLHPNSVAYGDIAAKATLFAMTELAGQSDLLVAYLPEASMGTALEMYSAYQAGVPVYAITPMVNNWVVRALARKVFEDLPAFLSHLATASELVD
jgi:hypothetical protein